MATPLTLENVYEAVKGVGDCRKFGEWLLYSRVSRYILQDSKLDAIHREHDSDKEACIKAVIEAFLRGEGFHQPSWRCVIDALYDAGEENHMAHDIIAYAEPVQGECVCVS